MKTGRFLVAVALTLCATAMLVFWKMPETQSMVGLDLLQPDLLFYVLGGFAACGWILVLAVPPDAMEKSVARS